MRLQPVFCLRSCSIFILLPEKQFGVVILSNILAPNISLDFIGLSRKIYDIAAEQ